MDGGRRVPRLKTGEERSAALERNQRETEERRRELSARARRATASFGLPHLRTVRTCPASLLNGVRTNSGDGAVGC